ncbi:hypothetical protein J4N45_08665 [Vibrio sp. SCSIO 43140]|uniref:hypothetical protein n=1 Tax=Vibrio sp. SCSIO 43140 TaxID=2819100 RepID=UPI0020765166|nr:hypothetical protein [Vibrio sp. SCSIO 43140]USD62010.1 hypothetical protein J4N45_08665 [Vibrio sp. SCSIO 43140]
MNTQFYTKLLIILAIGFPLSVYAGSDAAWRIHAPLKDWYIKDKLRYCTYQTGDTRFYIVQRSAEPCAKEAVGDIEPPKQVKKPSLKVPRKWADIQ